MTNFAKPKEGSCSVQVRHPGLGGETKEGRKHEGEGGKGKRGQRLDSEK